MKVTITKSPGNAETIAVEVPWNGSLAGWDATVQPILDILDARMHALNLRMLKGAQQLGELSPEAATAASRVLAMVNHVQLPHLEPEPEHVG